MYGRQVICDFAYAIVAIHKLFSFRPVETVKFRSKQKLSIIWLIHTELLVLNCRGILGEDTMLW